MNASEHAPAGQSDVLRSAWKRMVEMDIQSSRLSKQSMQLRRWIAILGVVATFLAIVTNELRGEVHEVAEQVLRGLLIIVPIVISVTAAYTNKFFGGANHLVMRAGSEEIKKEIYLYRTILRNHPERDRWLSRRMTTIQRRTYKSLGGELIIEPYEGKLPMYYNPDDPNSDPGFNDLTGDEYMRYRVIEQRDWHRRKNIQLKQERIRIQLIILVMGGVGALLAAIPPEWTPGWGLASWVAFTAAIASAFTGWEQLRGLDKILTIYSRVILELTIIRDEWEAIHPDQRTEADFVNMVRQAEDVMWAQNMQYISTMQEAITSGQGDEAELVENMLKEGDAVTRELHEKLIEEASGALSHASQELGKIVEESAATVKGMVSKAADSATGLQHKVKDTFDEEVQSFDDLVDANINRVTMETAEVRTAVDQVVGTVVDEVSETRESIETTSEYIAGEAREMRDTLEETVVEQAKAVHFAVEETSDWVSEEAQEILLNAQTTVEDGLKGSAALQETMEKASDAFLEGAEGANQVIETTVDVLVAEAQQLSESGMSLAEEEIEEIRETIDEKIHQEVGSLEGDSKVSSQLDSMLDEAAEVIESTTDSMRDKMAEEVAEQIVDLATDKKKKSGKKQSGVG